MNNIQLLISKKDKKYLDAWNSKTKNIGGSKVIYLTNNLVDIFIGDGWDNNFRIYLNRKEKSFSFSNSKHRTNVPLQRIVTSMLPQLLG